MTMHRKLLVIKIAVLWLFFLSCTGRSTTGDRDITTNTSTINPNKDVPYTIIEADKRNPSKSNEPKKAQPKPDNDPDDDDNDDDDDDFMYPDPEREPDEQKLMNHILRKYEKSVRPVRNASSTVTIKMGLTMTQIFDMDEKNQILVTNVWLDQEWNDEFLKWKPKNFGQIHTIRLPCHKIWLPDIVLYNNAAEYTDDQMPANAMIQSDGTVFWPVPTKLQSTCKLDVTYFPFDEQKCRLKFGSWTYDGFQVDITNRSDDVDISNYIVNGEWDLTNIFVERNVVIYPCCIEPFPDVTFHIYIKRRTLYYMYNVIFPCIMMSALTLLVFCLPPDSGEKIALGITVLLAFSVFMLAVAENLPETSEFVPLISIYLTIVMSMTSVSVIMTVFVLNLHHRGPNKTTVPQWLRKCLLMKRIPKNCCWERKPSIGEYYSSGEPATYIRNMSLKLTIENIAQEIREELENTSSDATADSISSAAGERADSCTYHSPRSNHHTSSRAAAGNNYPRTNQEILIALKKIIEKHDREEQEDEVIQEWREVAQRVDRVLFWIFLSATFCSSLFILVIAPMGKLL
ncbi:neuronal acetylcholine receptor subunit alpha-10-like [Tubulanus polymorphus]|uniref:neuronal acetylcholine receptor subunit alpha-10-like n=1 Tax=Tubulanus polymorphus TaxID=672921 RepID=UPI003DA4089B